MEPLEERVKWSESRVGDSDKIAAECRKEYELYQAHKISSEELELRMARISVGIVKDYAFVPPPEKPFQLAEFESDIRHDDWKRKSEAERNEVRNSLMKRNGISEYLTTVEHNTTENLSRAMWLERLLDLLKDRDKEAAKKVWDVYINFPLSIWIGNRMVWKRRQF